MIRSRGSVTRLSTCSAEAPGYWTKMSIIGTEIWGSSWRGVKKSPMSPRHMHAMSSMGVTGVLMNRRARRPAGPTVWAASARGAGGRGLGLRRSDMDSTLVDGAGVPGRGSMRDHP